MDECSGEVLPFPREVVDGLRSFAFGLNVAFLLAGLTQTFLFLSRLGNRTGIKTSFIAKFISALTILVHFISLSESSGQFYDSGYYYIIQDTNSVQIFCEAASILMLSLAVWSKLHGAMKHAVLGLCFSNAFLMTMLRLKSDQTFGGVLLTLTILTALGSMSALISAGKYSWAGGALCAAFTILLGFQHALYLLQVQELVPAPVASLCFTLVAGCVRFAFTIICAEDEVYCITKAEIGETEEIEEAEEEKLPGDKHIESESVGDLALAKESNEESRVGQEVRTDRWSEGENETGDKADLKKTGGTNGFKEEANGLMAWSDDEEEAESSGSESLVEFQRIDPLLSRSASYQAENTSRRELLRYVFHEMRAPLNSICMAVDLMTHHFKGSGTPKSSRLDLETLQIIEEATLTMERTLKDSMTLQKIEEGLLRPQMKIFSVHDLCDDIQDALSSVLQSTSVSLVYNVEAAIPEQIAGDHFRVRHVVAHVLSNAIKFSREGGVVNMKVFLQSLSPAALSPVPEEPPNSARSGGSAFESAAPSLDLAARADEREFVVFTISDSGVGMSCELQESDIFKPFNQLKTDEVTGFRGSGLGLAICKKIVSFLGGSITYSSIEGVGTTFTVMFPLTRLDDDDASSEGADELGAIPLSLTSPRTIKSKAIARAKSFRGEKLLSILYNQSNVFECPTPKLTSSASDNFHSFLDPDESPRMYSPVAPPGAFRNNIPSRMSVAFRNSVKEILIPSFDEGDVQAQSSNSNDRSELDDPPQFQLDLGLHSPLKTWKKAVSPVRKHSTASEPVNISPSRAMSFSMDTAAACSSPTSSFRSDGPSELLEALQRSPPLQAPRELKSEYVTLTEKNVNLHILRTAANESVRVLKHKPGGILKVATSKQELAAVLAACKVLVVDDALSNRKLLSMLLKRSGFGTVDTVEDGQAAVDYVKALLPNEQPRIIFMDNTMPKLTGIEASKVIRSGGFKHLIIGVTGNSLEEELDEFLSAGADLVIVKPLKNQALQQLLGFIQSNGFDSSHGFRIDLVGQQYTWVPRSLSGEESKK